MSDGHLRGDEGAACPDPADRRSFLLSLMAGAGASLAGLSGCLRAPTTGSAAGAEEERIDPFARVREVFPLRPGLAHLDTAACGCLSTPVIRAVTRALEALGADPVAACREELPAVAEEVRRKAAALLRVSVEEIAVTTGGWDGLSTIVSGLAVGPGDEVLTSWRDPGGVPRWWREVQERRGVRVRTFTPPAPPSSPEEIVDQVRRCLTPATRVVGLPHLDAATGLLYPLSAVSELVRPQGILFVVDGAQPPGMMDLDLGALGVDAYATAGHRWLCAPPGTGLLYVRRQVQDEIRPRVMADAGSVPRDARRFDAAGVRDLPAIVGLGTALDLLRTIGPGEVEARVRYLAGRLRQDAAKLPGTRLLTASGPELAAGVTTLGLEDAEAAEVAAALRRRFGISVAAHRALRLNAIAVSTHHYNSPEEIDRLLDALRKVT